LVKADAPERRVIVSERSNFPTDLYIAESVAATHGWTLKLVDAEEIEATLTADVALLMLTHVNYRSGRMLPMATLSRAAHAAGALVVWDLAHSAGAVPLNLKGDGPAEEAADFAVGCGYKYLNGGPGAPAFLWAHPRHTARMDRDHLRQPLSGWLGHAAPFDFAPAYQPASGISRFVCGTPPVLSMAALDAGLDVFLSAEAHGGMAALRRKSIALCELFIELVEANCSGQGLTLLSPREPSERGSQVSFAHTAEEPNSGHAVMQALIARGVVGDFRAGDPAVTPRTPDLLRFGFAPLYNRHVDAWDAANALKAVLASGEWREDRFNTRAAVT
jgi:kynureninase